MRDGQLNQQYNDDCVGHSSIESQCTDDQRMQRQISGPKDDESSDFQLREARGASPTSHSQLVWHLLVVLDRDVGVSAARSRRSTAIVLWTASWYDRARRFAQVSVLDERIGEVAWAGW